MRVVLKRVQKQIRAGWASECPELRIAAHGFSREAADENLTWTARLFFAPFVRDGTLKSELETLGIEGVEGNGELEFLLEP